MAQPNFLETIVHQEANAVRRLTELRLSADGLVEVVKQGEYARNESTNHDPVTAGGFDAYRYRVRGLRDTHCRPPYDWTPAREQNLELLCSPCGRRAIITRPGDEGVGDPGAHPQPTRELGDVSASAVAANTSLWLNPSWANVGNPARPARETWILLVRRSGDIVRAELSLASGEENGRVLAWLERIILPEIDLTNPGQIDSGSGSPPEEIDVPVTRKR